MQKNILLICDGGGFMIDALVNNLIKTSGFSVEKAAPSREDIEAGLDTADIILLFSDKYIYEKTEILEYLNGISDGNEKLLCLIGYDKELEELGKIIPDEKITRKFLRPFDMRKLAEELESVSALGDVSAPEKAKNILLVDDDSAFLKIMQKWLSPYYHVTIVSSGMQAITYIATNTPDLILLDFDMPITPGPQVFEMIRSEPASAEIPVIFLTGRSDRDSVARVMNLKPEGYLLKSMAKEDILDSVNHFFATKEWKAMK